MADFQNTRNCNLHSSAQAQQELENAQGIMARIEEEEDTTTSNQLYGSGIPSPPHSPQIASSPCVPMASIPEGPSDEASVKQLVDLEDSSNLWHNALNIKGPLEAAVDWEWIPGVFRKPGFQFSTQ